MTTTRIAPGLYRTADGHTVQAAEDFDGKRSGWHLINPAGEWMQTYALKRDALKALAETLADETPEPATEEITVTETPVAPTYAQDRVTFVRRGEDRVAVVDGVEIGTLFQGWTRLGGSGWTHDPKGQTHKTLKVAARPLISAALRDGRIVNAR